MLEVVKLVFIVTAVTVIQSCLLSNETACIFYVILQIYGVPYWQLTSNRYFVRVRYLQNQLAKIHRKQINHQLTSPQGTALSQQQLANFGDLQGGHQGWCERRISQ